VRSAVAFVPPHGTEVWRLSNHFAEGGKNAFNYTLDCCCVCLGKCTR